MKILTKKIFREIRFNKFRSIIIILTVFIAISIGIGLITLKNSMLTSINVSGEMLNNADVRIRLKNYIPEAEVSSLLTESEKEIAGITGLEGRIFKYSSIIFEGKSHKAYLIGIDFSKNLINKLKLKSGTYPATNDQVLVEQHFGSSLLFGSGANINDQLKINFENFSINVTISGFVADSEYIFVVDEETDMITMGDLCVIYMPLEVIQEILQVNGINEILVKTNERSHKANQICDQILSDIIGEDRIQKVIYWDESLERKWINLRLNAIEKIGIVFGLFGLIAGSIAIYNSLSKLIMSQRTHIGLYGALGAQKIDILQHYTNFGLFLGLIGIIFGWFGAVLTIFSLSQIAINAFGVITIRISINPFHWIGISFLALVLIFLFSLLSTVQISSLRPSEALKAPYSTTEIGSEPFLEQLLKPIGILKGMTSRIPIRAVFMNKRRSLSTVMVVAASMVILIATSSLFYDYILALDQNYQYYEKFDAKVLLSQSLPEREVNNWIQQNIEGIKTVEGFLYTSAWIGDQRVPLQAFHENSSLRDYNVIKGEKNISENKLLIGDKLAKNLELKIGEHVTLSFDSNNNISVEISGITGEFSENTLLWTIEGIQNNFIDIYNIGISENVTGFIFSYNESLTEDDKQDIEHLIQEKYQSFAYIDSNEVKETLNELLSTFMQLLIIVALLGLVTLILFTFSSMSLAILEREIEFLALRALGAKHRTILKIIFTENAIYGLFGFFIGMPISTALLRPIYNYILPDLYLPVIVPLEFWIIVASIILLCVFLSTILIAWKTWSRSLPDMLYNRMVS